MPDTAPATWEMSLTETETLPFDPTPLMGQGQTASSPVSSLVNLDTQTAIVLANAPALGPVNVVTQEIVGGTDVTIPGHYRLSVTFTASPSTNRRTMDLALNVVP